MSPCVIFNRFNVAPRCPVIRRERTSAGDYGVCQKRHLRAQQTATLFDHLVGAGKHRLRNGNTERFGGFEIDDQLVLGRRLHRQVCRFLAFENAIYITSRAPVRVDDIRPVGGEAPTRRVVSEPINVWQAVPQRQGNDQIAMVRYCRAPCHDQAAIPLTRECSDGALDLAGVPRVNGS
jgi:hypothetical protein